MPHLFKSFPARSVLFTSQCQGTILHEGHTGERKCSLSLESACRARELFCYRSASKDQLTLTSLHNQNSWLIPPPRQLGIFVKKNYSQDRKMTNSDNKQKPEIAGHLGSGEGERRAGRSPSPGDIEGCHINPTCVWGKALMGSRTICSAELMPCAGYDTYIQPWKGEEDCFHISESP